MRQRVNETDADYKVRRAAYDARRRQPKPSKLVVKGISTLTGPGGEVRGEWTKSTRAGRRDKDTIQLPGPKIIKRRATYYGTDGKVIGQWVTEEPKAAERFQLWKEIAAEFIRDIPRAKPTPAPTLDPNNLLVEYPVGDHHMGMLAWKHEGTDSYDLDIGETMLEKAFTYLSAVTPPATVGLIEFLGDLFHYDSPVPVTPTGKNNLDSDGRFPKMVRATVRAVRRSIEITLAKHAEVHVIVEIGNHDLYSSVFLMELLANVYENEPRVYIDTSPRHFHYYRHGHCLIGTHHGHGAKPEILPGIMAHDRPADWGDTLHRAWRTGHVHQKRAWDFPGCSVESARILPPADAWAHQKGYRPHRSMEAIVLDKNFGEVGRFPVTPQILESMS